VSIQHQKLLYHITNIKNMPAILDQGLLPRYQLVNFVDVADQDILKSRQKLKLENFVPFHFFARNPFDGRVQTDSPESKFILITITRAFAAQNNWKIVPKPPLADSDIELLEYEEGINVINWDKMNERDYSNDESKSVCMAECLSPEAVTPKCFHSIYVGTEESQQYVSGLLKQFNLSMYVDINDKMFLRK